MAPNVLVLIASQAIALMSSSENHKQKSFCENIKNLRPMWNAKHMSNYQNRKNDKFREGKSFLEEIFKMASNVSIQTASEGITLNRHKSNKNTIE